MLHSRRVFASLLCALFLVSTSGGSERPTPVRVLLVSGQNNHDWKSTTPVLVGLLEKSGKCQVRVTESPGNLTAAALAEFDVVVSNWNTYGKKAPAVPWPEVARAALVDFVRSGKGHVAVHAGSSSFPDWPEYREIGLAAWGAGTNHGSKHQFQVRFEQPTHPILKGIKEFKTTDELWNAPVVHPAAKVLCSAESVAGLPKGTGKWEPSAFVGQFGRGRTFTLLLGHDAAAMREPGFGTLFVRGVEWAATGVVKVTEPAANPE